MDRTLLRNVDGRNITKVKAVQTLRNQCSNFLQSVSILCANITTQTKTLPVAHLDLLSKLKQTCHHQFTVQVYSKPVYCTSVHKTSLLYKCTQSQFTVQVYTKPVYCTSVHKWLIMKGMYMDRTLLRNVDGRNITKVKAVQTMCKMCSKCVLTVYLLCANCVQAACKLVGSSLNKLKVAI